MATQEELIEGMREALKQNNKPLAKAIAVKLQNKEYDEESPWYKSTAIGAGQGATIGLSEELLAGGQAVGDVLFGDKSLGEAYDERLAQQREAQATARREDPWTTGLSEIGGGLLTGGRAMKGAVAGKGVKDVLLKGTGTGALLGGIGAYGYSEADPVKAALFGEEGEFKEEAKQMLYDVGQGGLIGGPLGLAMPALGMGTRALTRFLFAPRKSRIKEGNRLAVIEAIEEDIKSGAVKSWDDVERRLANDPDMIIADIGPNTQRLAEQVMHSGTPVGESFRKFAINRNRNQWDRIWSRTAQSLGTNDEVFGPAINKFLEDTAEQATELYALADPIKVSITPTMRNALKSDYFKDLLDDAQKLYKNKLLAEASEQGYEIDVKDIPKITLTNNAQKTEHVDQILKAMDLRVDALFNSGGKGSAEARTAKKLRDSFRDELVNQNEYLKRAKNLWYNSRKINEAAELGTSIFSKKFDPDIDVIKDMTPGEILAFRLGTAKALREKIGNKRLDADAIKGIFDVPLKTQAIKQAFGTREAFDEFMKFVEDESRKFELKEIAGGSPTKRRHSIESDVYEQISKLTGYSLGLGLGGGVPPSMAGYGAGKAYTNIRDAFGWGVAQRPQMMEQLYNIVGSETLDALSQPSLINPLLRTGAPTSASLFSGGTLSSGLLQDPEAYGGL